MTEQQGRLAAYWERQLDKLDEREQQRARKLPSWRTRKRRRTLAIVLVAANVVFVASAAVLSIVPQWLYFGLWSSGFAVGAVAYTLLKILTGRMSGGFSRLLDEREREWRHRVTYVGYQALVGLMLVAVIYGLFVANADDGGFRGATMLATLLAAGSTVPPIVLGWSLPDDDPEDFEEGLENA